ncbi:hypothetical protein P9G84_09885 [Brevibacillus centrosporus]|nr:hypothetical protein [Brevibacillus centrosporus]MEC2129278.1 hypothetical protein [Brevibacillus centrosporus]
MERNDRMIEHFECPWCGYVEDVRSLEEHIDMGQACSCCGMTDIDSHV